MSRLVTFLGLPLLLLGPVTAALAQTFTVFDAPNGVGTHGLSINAGGDVTGSFFDTLTHTLRGYVRDAGGNFTVFDAPVFESSINARGDVAGSIFDGNNVTAFVRDRNGNFTTFLAPNALGETTSRSINAAGEVTGDFVTDFGHGYVRDRNGNFTVFDAPNASNIFSFSINDSGDVTGYFFEFDASQGSKQRGFVRDQNGNFTVFDAPNASASVSGTASLSINNRGDVTGYFLDASQRKQRGFVRDQNGNFTVFDAPNALATTSISINAGGTVLGTFADASGAQHCFVRDRNGNFSVFDVPNAIITRCNSINDRGAVTGLLWYGDPSRKIGRASCRERV